LAPLAPAVGLNLKIGDRQKANDVERLVGLMDECGSAAGRPGRKLLGRDADGSTIGQMQNDGAETAGTRMN